MRTDSGIYAILNFLTGKFYVGQSSDLRARWRKHLSRLRSGKHPNPHLQSAWIKYGASAFIFVVLEFTSVDQLSAREQYLYGRSMPPEVRAKHIAAVAKPFCFIDPDGQTIEGRNIDKFARERGLNSGHMHSVHNGNLGQYKGWRRQGS